MSTIVSTTFKLPQAVVGNGVTTGDSFINPDNILYVDGDLAQSQSGDNQASDIIVGNFNLDLPQDAIITGIQLKLIAKRGGQTTPPISVTPVLIDNTTGSNVYWPGTPFTGLTTDLDQYILGNQAELWGNNTWTVNQINNLRVQLVANGFIEVDSVLVQAFYYELPSPIAPVITNGHCVDCNSTVQAQPFVLARSFLSTETSFLLKSFNLPDGTPITLDMLGDCGGEITIVFDKGKPKTDGSNFEENAVITSDDAIISILPNGYVQIELGSIQNRGIGFTSPFAHDANLLSDHEVGTQVIISNSGRYQDRFLQKCHIGVLVASPLSALDDGNIISDDIRSLNFTGVAVSATATPNPTGGDDITVNVVGAGGTVPPALKEVSTATTGTARATTLNWLHDSSGIDRLLVVDISSEDTTTFSSVTYDGVPMTLESSDVQGTVKAFRYYLKNPTTGTHPIVVIATAPSYISAGARTYAGVDQTAPFDGVTVPGTGTGTSATASHTTTQNSSLVIDLIATGVQPVTHTSASGQTKDFTIVTAASRQITGGGQSTGMPGVFPTNYNISPSTNYVILPGAIKGITTPAVGGGFTLYADTGSQVVPGGGTLYAITNSNATDVLSTEVAAGGGGSIIHSTYFKTATASNGQVPMFNSSTGKMEWGNPGSGGSFNVTGNIGSGTINGGDNVLLLTNSNTSDVLLTEFGTSGTTKTIDVRFKTTTATNGQSVRFNASTGKMEWYTPGSGGGSITRTYGTYFQDFDGPLYFTSGGGGTVQNFAGVYPFTINSSSGITQTTLPGHPGVLDYVVPSGGPTTLGFDLIGFDLNNLQVDFMVLLNQTFSAPYIQIPVNGGALAVSIGQSLSNINNTSVSHAAVALNTWNVFTVTYNTAGTSCSLSINGTVVASGLPTSIAPTSIGVGGSYYQIDYIAANGSITR